jgi:shikimate dehydrogenase
VTGKQTFGLVGHKIGYSKSPDIFSSIFRHSQIDGEFRLFDLTPEAFEGQFRRLLGDSLTGLAVTIPYKQRVMAYLDELDPVAKLLGAVNSISIRNGRTIGFNTDAFGFSLPLRPHAALLNQGSAIIFGSGGGARAAICSLRTDYNLLKFLVVGRSSHKLAQFREAMTECLGNATIDLCLAENTAKIIESSYDVVVNCTPLGGWNAPNASPLPEGFRWRKGKVYYDLNYNSGNVLVDEAVREGLSSIDGSGMLVGQAIRSWHLWTGLQAEFDPVYADVFAQ